MALGEKSLADRTAAKQATDNTVRSSNGGQGDPSKAGSKQALKLSDFDRELMRAQGITDEKEYIKHRDGDFEVDVPMGDK
jgi:hypothetical protein